MTSTPFLWINKTASSASLSHSDTLEHLQLLSHAQHVSRRSKRPRRSAKRPQHAEGDDRQAISAAASKIAPINPVCRRTYIEPALATDPSWTSSERRALVFYRRMTVDKIIAGDRDALFWRELVVGLIGSHPAFRHLVVAIAATHELLVAEDARQMNRFALHQCTKATHLLRTSSDMSPEILVVSCILLSAYYLLRCDLESTDRVVDLGLRMATPSVQSPAEPSSSCWTTGDSTRILSSLKQQHGYKLWAHDVVFQFEKTSAAKKSLVLHLDCVKGPFVDFNQAYASYKALAVEIITKVLRNLGAGAYVEPSCSLSQEVAHQLSSFAYHWEHYYASLSSADESEKLAMLQLRLASWILHLLFYTRIICTDEFQVDHHATLCHRMLRLGEYLLAARRAGRDVKYVDRLVNGSIYTLGLLSRRDIRQQAAGLLQSQIEFPDGTVNWLRGMIILMFEEVEQGLDDDPRHGKETIGKPVLAGFHCRKDEMAVVLEYYLRRPDGPVKRMEHSSKLQSPLQVELSADEVDRCLQGLMAGYRMYGKPVTMPELRGSIRPMVLTGGQSLYAYSRMRSLSQRDRSGMNSLLRNTLITRGFSKRVRGSPGRDKRKARKGSGGSQIRPIIDTKDRRLDPAYRSRCG